MTNCPGLYFGIGKKARDLLYKDYAQQPPFHFQYKCFNCSFCLSSQIEAMEPGLKTVFKVVVPDSGKVEVRYLHDYLGVSAGIGLKATSWNSLKGREPVVGIDPMLNFSGVVGNSLFSLGTDIAYDLSKMTFNKYNAGLSFNSSFLVASLTMNEKFDTLKASCYRALTTLVGTETAIAAELKHCFYNNGPTTFTIGAQHTFFTSTQLKGRIDSDGKVAALVQQGLWEKLFFAFAGEVDFKAMNMIPKIGFSMTFRP